MSSTFLGRLCVWPHDHKADGQLGPVLGGLEDVMKELMGQYNCSQIRLLVTTSGALRVRVVGQLKPELGTAKGDDDADEEEEDWLLDVTAENGSPSDWAKLLCTDLVSLSTKQAIPPPRGQVLPIQRAAAACFVQAAKQIMLQAPQLQRMSLTITQKLLDTCTCAHFSRLIWHLCNTHRPSAQQLQDQAGQLTEEALWLLVAAPPYAQHTAVVWQWSTDCCSLVALLHQLQLLEVGQGAKVDVLNAVHQLLLIATTPPAELQQNKLLQRPVTSAERSAAKQWLQSQGVLLSEVLTAAEADNLFDTTGICSLCGEEEDAAGRKLIPCRSCTHEYHLSCAKSEGKGSRLLAPDLQQLKRGEDGKGTCLGCQGFPLSDSFWQDLYKEQDAAAPAAAPAAAAGEGGPGTAARAGRSPGAKAATPKKPGKQQQRAAGSAAAAAAGPDAEGPGDHFTLAKSPLARRQPAGTAAAATAAGNMGPAAGLHADMGGGDDALEALLATQVLYVDGEEAAADAPAAAHDEVQHDGGSNGSQGGGGSSSAGGSSGAGGSSSKGDDSSQGGSSGKGGSDGDSGDAASAGQGGDSGSSSEEQGEGDTSDDGTEDADGEEHDEGDADNEAAAGSHPSSSSDPSSSSSDPSSSSSSSDESEEGSGEAANGAVDSSEEEFTLVKRKTPGKQQQQQREADGASGAGKASNRVTPPTPPPGSSSGGQAAAAAGQPRTGSKTAKQGSAAAAGATMQARAPAAGVESPAPSGGRAKRKQAAAAADAADADADAEAPASQDDATHRGGPRPPGSQPVRAAAAAAKASIAAAAAPKRGPASPAKKRQQVEPAAGAGRISRAAAAAAAAAAADKAPGVSASQTFSADEAADALLSLLDCSAGPQHSPAHTTDRLAAAAAASGPAGKAAAGRGTGSGTGRPRGRPPGPGRGRGRGRLSAGAIAAEPAASLVGRGGGQGVKRGRAALAEAVDAALRYSAQPGDGTEGDGNAAAAAAAAGGSDPAAKRARAADPSAQQQRAETRQQRGQQQQQRGRGDEELQGAAEGAEDMQVDAPEQQQQQAGRNRHNPAAGGGKSAAAAAGGDLPVIQLPPGQHQEILQSRQHQQQRQQLARVTQQELLLQLRRRLLILHHADHKTLRRQLLMLLGEASEGLSNFVAATLLALFAPAAGAPGGEKAAAAHALAATAEAVMQGSKGAAEVCLGAGLPPTAAAQGAAGASSSTAAAAGGQGRRRTSLGPAGAEQALQQWDWVGLASNIVGPLAGYLDAQVRWDLVIGGIPAAAVQHRADCTGACLQVFSALYYRTETEQQEVGGAAGEDGGSLQHRRSVLLRVLLTGRDVLRQLEGLVTDKPAVAAALAGDPAAAAAAGGSSSSGAASAAHARVLGCSFASLMGRLVADAAAAVADESTSAAELDSCQAACQHLLQLARALNVDPVQLLLLTDWQPLQQMLGDARGNEASWAATAEVLQGVEGFFSSCMAIEGMEGGEGDGEEDTGVLRLQHLPTGMIEQLLQVLAAAGKLFARVREDRQQQQERECSAARERSMQEREAALSDLLPRLYKLLRGALGRVAAASGQQEALLQGPVMFARKAVQMARAVLQVLLLPDDVLGDFVLELQESSNKGLVGGTCVLLDDIVPAEIEIDCWYNASEALGWSILECKRVLAAAQAGA